MAKGQNKEMLYRVVKFEICPNQQQIALLEKISENLRRVWNEALQGRNSMFENYIAPVYAQISAIEKSQDCEGVQILRKELGDLFKKYRISLFDQINALTSRREGDSHFASVQRNWQEETLDTLEGSFKSFLALRKNGDPDARIPRPKDEGYFCEIPGRFGFSIRNSTFQLSCKKVFGETEFIFPIPEYQQLRLSHAVKIRKFTLYRDERDMAKPGRFWVSVAYDISRKTLERFVPEHAVYLSLGASSIGIVSSCGEETVPLWRADKYWKPKVDSVIERLKVCKEGSRKWHRRNNAKRTMQKKMGAQQKIDRREIVANLLTHGVHFVVTDIVVRSKEGKLADGSNPERGGSPKGLNWSAQNTGSIGYLTSWLEEKVREHGGSVTKHKLRLDSPPEVQGHDNKIWMARKLKESFLASLEKKVG